MAREALRRREAGFTLLEMLIALAIFSLARGLAIVRLRGCLGAECVRPPRANDGTGRCPQPHGRATDRSATAIFRQRGQAGRRISGAQWAWRRGRRRCRTSRLAAITIRVEGGPGQSPAIISFGETDAVTKRTSTSVTLSLPLAGGSEEWARLSGLRGLASSGRLGPP